MRSKTQIQNISGQPKDAPKIAIAAVLVGIILLRVMDIFSPPPLNSPVCTPTLADRAVISCAVRSVQNWRASSGRAIVSR
jgi:hypothetical protein